MPSVWQVGIEDVDPTTVELHHVHAAVSRWFDTHDGEHHATDKPYAISPLATQTGTTMIEVRTLTILAEGRLREHAIPGRTLRLGRQTARVVTVERSRHESWDDLASFSGAHRWLLTFDTPVTFRKGNRSTPLPDPASIENSLTRTWSTWSPKTLGGQADLWVSDLSLTSEVMQIATNRQRLVVPGSSGWMMLRAAGSPGTADRLLRMASYSGIGPFTLKGLGVTRVRPMLPRPGRARAEG